MRLLCQFERAAVLPFLQSHDAYRVEEVLPYTERFAVADAQVRTASHYSSHLACFLDATERFQVMWDCFNTVPWNFWGLE